MRKPDGPARARLLDFEPYCTSPIEGSFFDVFEQYRDPYIFIRPQQVIQTPFKKFRMDFLLIKDGFRIGIECDGKKYHNLAHDEIRDALILGSHLVDAIFHFFGRHLIYSAEDCVYTISRYYPQFFSQEGREAIARLANPYVRELLDPSKSINYCDILESSSAQYFPDDLGDLEIRELCQLDPFISIHHSLISRDNKAPDFGRAFDVIMIRGFKSYEKILKAYRHPGMAEEDYEQIIISTPPNTLYKLLGLATSRASVYREQCKLHSYVYLPRPGSTDPSLARMKDSDFWKTFTGESANMKDAKFQYITADSPYITGKHHKR